MYETLNDKKYNRKVIFLDLLPHPQELNLAPLGVLAPQVKKHCLSHCPHFGTLCKNGSNYRGQISGGRFPCRRLPHLILFSYWVCYSLAATVCRVAGGVVSGLELVNGTLPCLRRHGL